MFNVIIEVTKAMMLNQKAISTGYIKFLVKKHYYFPTFIAVAVSGSCHSA